MKKSAVLTGLLALCLGAPARTAPVPDSAGVAAGLAAFRQGRFAEAYEAFAAAAVTGDARAARYVGVMYDTGEGIRQDRREAVEWYRRAALLGDPVGMFNVGVSYDGGIDVARDHREAARWYRRAAALHDGRAEYNLGLMYRDGDGVPRSRTEATRLFRAAAADGATAAYAQLGGSARGARPADAARKLVTHGQPSGQDEFLQAQRALLSRRPRDMADAVALFRQAAAAGGPAAAAALYDLGWCYQTGTGVAADPSRAYALYVRAAAVTEDRSLRDLAETGAAALHAPPPPAR